MNKIQIKAAIRLATGKPIDVVAKEHGYSKHTFYRIINNEFNSPKVQAIIAGIIGKPVSEIWPEIKQKNASTPGGGSSPVVGSVGRTSDPIRG